MNFNRHLHLKGKHAFLSASKYSWLRYSDEKLLNTYANHLASVKGTKLHDFAADAIKMGIYVNDKENLLTAYVRDCIDLGLQVEQPLFYSNNCFGTADAIGFKDGVLLINDLKTGSSATSFDQLKIYSAIFCLEYGVHPSKLKKIILRIYQFGEYTEEQPHFSEIDKIAEQIKYFDSMINLMNERGGDTSWYF